MPIVTGNGQIYADSDRHWTNIRPMTGNRYYIIIYMIPARGPQTVFKQNLCGQLHSSTSEATLGLHCFCIAFALLFIASEATEATSKLPDNKPYSFEKQESMLLPRFCIAFHCF